MPFHFQLYSYLKFSAAFNSSILYTNLIPLNVTIIHIDLLIYLLRVSFQV